MNSYLYMGWVVIIGDESTTIYNLNNHLERMEFPTEAEATEWIDEQN